jgi:hypothetical protein
VAPCEASYDGKPTSWWRYELEHWDYLLGNGTQLKVGPRFRRNPTAFEAIRDQWFPRRPPPVADRWDNLSVNFWGPFRGPRLLHGDDDAQPVLRELLDDAAPTIRRLAEIGIREYANKRGRMIE